MKYEFKIECKECGYHGSTDTIRSFHGLGKHDVVKYVCPNCHSRNIEYKPREGMKWLAGMSRSKELKKMEERCDKK
jgi:Zn finger protein HypA/HybF involved in hydrogenase expression